MGSDGVKNGVTPEEQRAWEKKIPPDHVYPRMPSIDRVFHEQVLRLAKGIIKLYEEWIKARNR